MLNSYSGIVSPGFDGRVVYTHGPGIDQPVSVWRQSSMCTFTVFPHVNFMGRLASGTHPAGTTSCARVDWAGGESLPFRGNSVAAKNQPWNGSLADQGTDASGLQYMRNRYYNPASGQFTQEDPIGLAGGMNLYGFAGGDPVNFSDPFGLWPLWTHDAIIDAALPKAGFIDRQLVKLGSLIHDVTTQGTSQSYLHSMAENGQNPLAQAAGTSEFVENATGAAAGLQATGHHVMAMLELGAAIHPLMDATSPAHTNGNGKPRIWNPSELAAHRRAEAGSPTVAQQKKMNTQIQERYQQVMKP